MFRRLTSLLVIAAVMYVATSAGRTCRAETRNHEGYKNAVATAREVLWRALTSGKGSGASVAIMDQGEIVYSETFGVADRSENRPVDRETRFNIGSTSKMFVAVAILQLMDEGKVALDKSVAAYIPEFTMKDERYKKITVRMLFNHSSGLPGTSFYFGYKPDSRVHQVLLDTLKDSHLKHDPGAMAIYCNDGFTLAEIIVEKVSGMKYMDYLRERVFVPLEMAHTAASVGEISEPNVAEYYDPRAGKKYPREVLAVYAAGGLSSTAEDLCRFGDGVSGKGKRILSDAAMGELLKAQPVAFSDKLKDRQLLGQFGWEYSNIADYQARGIQVLGKGGNTAFYSSNLQVVPGKRMALGLVISGQATGEELTRPILDALMKDKMLWDRRAGTGKRPTPPAPIPSNLTKYAGYYVNQTEAVKVSFGKGYRTFTINPVGSKKTETEKSQFPMVFTYDDGYFRNPAQGLSCYFTAVGGTSFIALHEMPFYGVDTLLLQKLSSMKRPAQLRPGINGKVWLVKNVPPHVAVVGPDLIVTSSVHKHLPGYVDFAGIKRVEAFDHAGMAATAFRDQSELWVHSLSNGLWAKSGCFLFSTADNVPKIKVGTTSVRIGEENYDEWARLEKSALLTFEKPDEGRIIVLTERAVLFDSVLDSDEVRAPAGSYVFIAGSAGDVFKVHAK